MTPDRATPDELEQRAALTTGWRGRLLRQLAAEAREYKPEPLEIVTTYRRVA